MRTPAKLRTLTADEIKEIKRLAYSSKDPIRLVQRARIITFMLEDPTLYASAAGLKAGFRSISVGAVWVRRFNKRGIAGLYNQSRLGRRPIHSAEVHNALIALALQKPSSLGYPFETWTLERLQHSFRERQGVHLSDSTIWEWLDAEGLDWKHP